MTTMNPVGPAVLQISSNRIATAIAKMEATLKNASASLLAELAVEVIVDHREYFEWQETKSLAYSMCLINLEEAQTLWEYLGQTEQQFNKNSIAVRIVVAKTMSMLRKAVHT